MRALWGDFFCSVFGSEGSAAQGLGGFSIGLNSLRVSS